MTEQETIERLKKDYAGVLGNLKGQKLHYVVIEGRGLGFVLREPSLKDIIKANAKLTSLAGGNLTEAGIIIFESCLIAGAIDAQIMEDNRLLVSAYNASCMVLSDESEEKKS